MSQATNYKKLFVQQTYSMIKKANEVHRRFNTKIIIYISDSTDILIYQSYNNQLSIIGNTIAEIKAGERPKQLVFSLTDFIIISNTIQAILATILGYSKLP